MLRSQKQGYGVLTTNMNVLWVNGVYENVTLQKYHYLISITLLKQEHRTNSAEFSHETTFWS